MAPHPHPNNYAYDAAAGYFASINPALLAKTSNTPETQPKDPGQHDVSTSDFIYNEQLWAHALGAIGSSNPGHPHATLGGPLNPGLNPYPDPTHTSPDRLDRTGLNPIALWANDTVELRQDTEELRQDTEELRQVVWPSEIPGNHVAQTPMRIRVRREKENTTSRHRLVPSDDATRRSPRLNRRAIAATSRTGASTVPGPSVRRARTTSSNECQTAQCFFRNCTKVLSDQRALERHLDTHFEHRFMCSVKTCKKTWSRNPGASNSHTKKCKASTVVVLSEKAYWRLKEYASELRQPQPDNPLLKDESLEWLKHLPEDWEQYV